MSDSLVSAATGYEPVAGRGHRSLIEGLVADLIVSAGEAGSCGPRPLTNPEAIVEEVTRRAPLVTLDEAREIARRVHLQLFGLGPIDDLVHDPTITDIMINGPGPVWIERNGSLLSTGVELDRQGIDVLIERIVAPLGLRADRLAPMVDARLPDGARVNAVLPPLAVDGPYVTIRRFRPSPFRLEDFAEPWMVEILRRSVRCRHNIMVSGGTGAGKTSLLNSLTDLIADTERVITIEDAAELRFSGRHVVRLEARPGNSEGRGEVTIRALVRNALRMRPDRIIVGEVRGPEALDMVQAMSTGHDGSLSTCHANSPADALRRLETMILMAGLELPLEAVRDRLRAALDVVVQVARLVDGSRRVVAICAVTDDGVHRLDATSPPPQRSRS